MRGIQTVLGSNFVARNDVTLVASRLPFNSPRYSLASRTPGFVANPGGSPCNLCLGGAVGRFNSVHLNSVASGSGTLHRDLQQIPSPSGSVSVLPGETGHFRTWHPDSDAGSATSNSRLTF